MKTMFFAALVIGIVGAGTVYAAPAATVDTNTRTTVTTPGNQGISPNVQGSTNGTVGASPNTNATPAPGVSISNSAENSVSPNCGSSDTNAADGTTSGTRGSCNNK